ncbi:MAG: amidohydrolase family protein [Pseudonocardiaceae bacterium]
MPSQERTPGIFDAHARLAPGDEARQRLIAVMDECGISHALVAAGQVVRAEVLSRLAVEGGGIDVDADNAAVLGSCRVSGGRLVPLFFGNPHRPPGHYAECADQFHGLDLAPCLHGIGLDDERTAALVAVAAEVGHPVYLHCLARPGFTVRDLTTLAARFDTVNFILGHGGIGDLDFYGIDLIRTYPNVYFETSGGYSSVAKAAIEALGAHRVLFGSEYPLQHPRVELEKFRVLNLPPTTWAAVSSHNIRRLLQLFPHSAGSAGLLTPGLPR